MRGTLACWHVGTAARTRDPSDLAELVKEVGSQPPDAPHHRRPSRAVGQHDRKRSRPPPRGGVLQKTTQQAAAAVPPRPRAGTLGRWFPRPLSMEGGLV